MGSRKPSAKAKRVAEFKAGLGDMDGIFAREQAHQEKIAKNKDVVLEKKACTSKNRYASRWEAEAAIESCAEHGTGGLHCYQCPYCNGWHLTSKPQRT
ncbi:MAG: hypothetical protein Q4E12_01670 [Coriobacteriia bacterium]|nr:hypothetical protein [Coriobacteriia bacterium]